MHDALYALAKEFDLIQIEVTLKLKKDGRLPSFKGSLWHGWLGHVLRRYDPNAYHICFGTHSEFHPKPYMVCPDGNMQTDWRKNQLIRFQLTLFGRATDLAFSIVKAIHDACNDELLVLGPDKIPIDLLTIASLTPLGKTVGLQVHCLRDWLISPYIEASNKPQEIALQFTTPIRVKYQGQILHHSVNDLTFWLNQISRRFVQLSQYWSVDSPEHVDSFYDDWKSRVPVNIELKSDLYFEDWQRFSKKQKEALPFGGLMGQLSAYGELSSLLPLLMIGERLHVGGKTTFGLGQYQLIAG